MKSIWHDTLSRIMQYMTLKRSIPELDFKLACCYYTKSLTNAEYKMG